MTRSVGVFICCLLLTISATAKPAFADSTRNRQWHLIALDTSDAQKISNGAGVTVAVIDTGVRADHQDLVGNVLPGDDRIAAGTKGWVDDDGHGTAMAGLIAAHGHGSERANGALGIAPAAKILPIRAFSDKNHASSDLPAAIDYAIKRGAGVISMSFETASTVALQKAVESAIKANIIVVAGTGNKPDQIFLQYPAKYPGVVAVGATGPDGKIAPVTVTGKEMTLTAPGVDITSTSRSGGYQSADGTSDATAIVAGAAALVRSKYPSLSASEVVHRLTATAVDKGPPGRDSSYGFGELNLLGALTADVPPATAAPSAGATTPTSAVARPPSKPAVRVNWVAAVALGAVLLAVIVLFIWLVLRGRRRRPRTFGP